jgi:hypothetical protein
VLRGVATDAGGVRCRHHGRSLAGIARRATYAGAAVFYIGFASVAISMMIGWDHGGSSDQVARSGQLGCSPSYSADGWSARSV